MIFLSDCEDADGNCLPLESSHFRCRINDKVHESCACENGFGGMVQYFVIEEERSVMEEVGGTYTICNDFHSFEIVHHSLIV